jgi:outer membrane protein assembly factor BamB
VSRRARVVLAILAVAGLACSRNSTTAGSPADPPPPGAPPGAPPRAQPQAPPATGSAAPVRLAGAAVAAPATAAGCQQLPFAGSTPVPEASGAAWLAVDGKPMLVIVSDSGNDGAYALVDPETGATTETGTLPMSAETSDDIEGVAVRKDELLGITSSGWIRVWQRRGKGFAPAGAPYPLGPVDLPDAMNNSRPPEGDGMVCNPRAVNCGRNYEGLCLAPAPRAGCVGFAVSKADGHLYCLTDESGKLVVHRRRAIAVARPGTLADCAFGDDGTLWAGSNLFDLGAVYRVAGWDDPANAKVERVGSLAIGFPEVIAVRGDVVYRMSDTGGAPSLMARFRCPR